MKTILPTLLLLFSLQLHAQDFTRGPFTNQQMGGLVVADFNGDGFEDVIGRHFETEIVLMLNDGVDSISFTKKDLGLSFEPVGTPGVADIDGDNDMDVIFADADYNLSLFTNDGNANFAASTLNIGGTFTLQVKDFEGDGDMDIIGINSIDNMLDIYINDGNQSFTKTNLISTTDDLVRFDVADMDADGDMDIVVGYDESFSQIVLHLNDGSNGFTSMPLTNDFDQLQDLKITDLDKNGELDILAIDRFSGQVWGNLGNLDFVELPLFSYDFTSGIGLYRTVAVGDYNGDESPDIMAGDNSEDIVWFKNTSLSLLNYEVGFVGTIAPVFSIANGDFDNDGDLDVAVSNGEFWWYENEIEQITISTLDFETAQFEVFPNPFQDIIQIKNIPSGQYQMTLTNAAGVQVYSSLISSDIIDLSNLQNGMYFLTLDNVDTKESQSTQLIKLK